MPAGMNDPLLGEEQPALATRLRPALLITGGAVLLSLGSALGSTLLSAFGSPMLMGIGSLIAVPCWRIAQGALAVLLIIVAEYRAANAGRAVHPWQGAALTGAAELAFVIVFTAAFTLTMWSSGLGPSSLARMIEDVFEGTVALFTEIPLITLSLVGAATLPGAWLAYRLQTRRTPAGRSQLAGLAGTMLLLRIAGAALVFGGFAAQAAIDGWYGFGAEEMLVGALLGGTEAVLYSLGVAALLLTTNRLRLEMAADAAAPPSDEHVVERGGDRVDQPIRFRDPDAERRVGDDDVAKRADDDAV
jgi:hypothetical protein